VIGLDTNFLLRYLLHDDATQAQRAVQRMEQEISAGQGFYVNHIVLCEMVWVLGSRYGLDKSDIVYALENLFAANQFHFEQRDVALRAFSDYRNGQAGFADCLIGRKNQAANCDKTLSFDKSAGRLETL
jgi:predicted nucleic-acid-binding protein